MSSTNRGAKRKKLDQYFTPRPVSDALVSLMAERIVAPLDVLEPSAGGGAFVGSMRAQWPESHITAVDIDSACMRPEAEDELTRWLPGDFLEHQGSYSVVIGNPPFSQALDHVRHAIELLTPRGLVGFLLRLGFLESSRRFGFNTTHMPLEVHVLDRRPSFTGQGCDSTPYAFFIWGKKPRTAPAKLHCISWKVDV